MGEDLGYWFFFLYRMTIWLFDLYDNLFYVDIGWYINGFGVIIFIFFSVIGAIIWWFGMGYWCCSLKVDFRVNWVRFNWSFYGFLGFWFLVFVFMWGFIGIYFVFFELFIEFVDRLELINEEIFELWTVDNVLYWFVCVHFGRFGGWLTKILWVLVSLILFIFFCYWFFNVVESCDQVF